ncbi:MAG: hypothetical protein MJ250_01355 [Alphaproteobacteria bacterium]|nr:hypothetical protein [Alphaproteobacteria bacterium]
MSIRNLNTDKIFNLNFFPYLKINEYTYDWGFFFTKTESFLCAFIVALILCGLVFTKAYYRDTVSRKYYIFFSLLTFFVTLGIGANQFIQFFAGFEVVILLTYLMMVFVNNKSIVQKNAGKFFISHLFSDIFILFAFYMIINKTDSLLIPPHISQQVIIFDTTEQTLFGCFLLLGIGEKMLQFFSLNNDEDVSICTDFVILSVVFSAVFAGYSVYILLNLFDFCIANTFVKSLFIATGIITSFLYGIKGLYKTNLKEKIYSILAMQMGLILILFAIADKDTCVRSYIAITVPIVGIILSLGSLSFALQGELDINKMGELSKEYSALFWIYSLFVLCVIGFPGLGTFSVWQDLFALIYIKFSIYTCILFVLFLFMMGWIFSDCLYKIFFSKRNISTEKIISLKKIDKIMLIPIVLLLVSTIFQDQIFQQSVLEHLSKRQSIYMLICSMCGCSGLCFGLFFFKTGIKINFSIFSKLFEKKLLSSYLNKNKDIIIQQQCLLILSENIVNKFYKKLESKKNFFKNNTLLIVLIFLGLTFIMIQRLYLCNF